MAPEAVRQAVGGGCRSGWGGYCRLQMRHLPPGGQWLGIGWAPWRGGGVPPPFQCNSLGGGGVRSPKFVPKMAQIHTSFCAFHLFPMTSGSKGGAGVQGGGGGHSPLLLRLPAVLRLPRLTPSHKPSAAARTPSPCPTKSFVRNAPNQEAAHAPLHPPPIAMATPPVGHAGPRWSPYRALHCPPFVPPQRASGHRCLFSLGAGACLPPPPSRTPPTQLSRRGGGGVAVSERRIQLKKIAGNRGEIEGKYGKLREIAEKLRCRTRTSRSLKGQHLCAGDTQDTHAGGEQQLRKRCGKLGKPATIFQKCGIPKSCEELRTSTSAAPRLRLAWHGSPW